MSCSITDRQSALEAELRSVQASRRDLENFLKWMQEAETTVNVLADASQRENALQDTILAKELTQQMQASARGSAASVFICAALVWSIHMQISYLEKVRLSPYDVRKSMHSCE